MQRYLETSEYIDWGHPAVRDKAANLAVGAVDEMAIVRNCFQFVRDEIHHSWDLRLNPVTSKASDVLRHGTGYCYAKSHLLAALLCANGIPAGLCYQRLKVEPDGSRYSLHGLNAVYLKQQGWYRVDVRGNKDGVQADFEPPNEKLAFSIADPGEADLPEIWAEPINTVVQILRDSMTIEDVYRNLPDVELLSS